MTRTFAPTASINSTRDQLFDAQPGAYIDGIRADLYPAVMAAQRHPLDPSEVIYRGGRRIYGEGGER